MNDETSEALRCLARKYRTEILKLSAICLVMLLLSWSVALSHSIRCNRWEHWYRLRLEEQQSLEKPLTLAKLEKGRRRWLKINKLEKQLGISELEALWTNKIKHEPPPCILLRFPEVDKVIIRHNTIECEQ